MGQAKQRGTKEERIKQSIEHAKQVKLERDAKQLAERLEQQRVARERVLDGEYIPTPKPKFNKVLMLMAIGALSAGITVR